MALKNQEYITPRAILEKGILKMNRDELNKSIDECEAVLSIKELNKWLKVAKEEFPEAKIQYKLKEKEEWEQL